MTTPRNFDTAALNWDEEPRRVKLATEIAAAISAALPLDPQWDALDFGCGTGLVTLQLAPLLGSITGVDSSAGMLDKLKSKIASAGITSVRTCQCGLDATGLPPGPFQLITSAMTLHHIQEPAALLTIFHKHLQPGGWLALADLESEDGTFHEDATGVFHHGFSTVELIALLAEAGFKPGMFSTATAVVKGEHSFPVFLLVAQAPE
jgi:ubiquinone/menaquinone biosynthesis C-methylase UbiE